MTYERWQNLISTIKDKFKVTKEGREELNPGPGHVEFIECGTPLGKVRLELIVKPKILEKKTYYSNRVGSQTTVEYRYDENEHTLTLKALRWNEESDTWQEVKAESLTTHL
jgi:hypothetical protein